MNYLALLGWSPGTIDDDPAARRADRARSTWRACRSNPAAFDTEKLTWMNNHYIQSLDDDELAARACTS